MRSEYRTQIDQKYAKKIEAIVRKAPNGIKDAEDPYQDEAQLCPICECKLQIMELSCHQCKTNLPMCIATVIIDRVKIFLVQNIFDSIFVFLVLGSAYLCRGCCSLPLLRFSLLQATNDQVCLPAEIFNRNFINFST